MGGEATAGPRQHREARSRVAPLISCSHYLFSISHLLPKRSAPKGASAGAEVAAPRVPHERGHLPSRQPARRRDEAVRACLARAQIHGQVGSLQFEDLHELAGSRTAFTVHCGSMASVAQRGTGKPGMRGRTRNGWLLSSSSWEAGVVWTARDCSGVADRRCIYERRCRREGARGPSGLKRRRGFSRQRRHRPRAAAWLQALGKRARLRRSVQASKRHR